MARRRWRMLFFTGASAPGGESTLSATTTRSNPSGAAALAEETPFTGSDHIVESTRLAFLRRSASPLFPIWPSTGGWPRTLRRVSPSRRPPGAVAVRVPGRMGRVSCMRRAGRWSRAWARPSPSDLLVFFRGPGRGAFDFSLPHKIRPAEPEGERVLRAAVLLTGAWSAIDLRVGRQRGSLRVQGAFAEQGVDEPHVYNGEPAEPELCAGWLGLTEGGGG